MPRTTFIERILPLSGQWHEGRLVVSGGYTDLAWASTRLAPIIQEVVQAEIIFSESPQF
jgi:hypothetical protein